MPTNNDADAEVVFEYTGEGCVVPISVTIVRFHPSVIEVEEEAFEDCKQLREIIFNNGLQKIGQYAFHRCSSLSSIKLPSTVTEIGDWAFYRCKNLRVVLNEGLQKIGVRAFVQCTTLSGVILPSTVIEIGDWAFGGCNSLRAVILNNGLQKIGGDSFWACTSLSSITIPSTVTEIGEGAFDRCNNLREVMFNGVPRKIGQYAFSTCRNLREVIFHGVPREIAKNAFYGCSSLERFAFPTISSRLNTLIRTGHWEEIENEVNEVRGVVERSGSEFFVSSEAMGEGRNWSAVRESLGKIGRLISCYELKEATSMLELALWKFKLDQVDKANPIPRKKCRMDVPGPVKDIIRQYLPYECLLPLSDV